MSPQSVESLPGLVDHWATVFPERTAFVLLPDGGDDPTQRVEMTFAELQFQSRRAAVELSVVAPPGARVVLLYPFGLDFITAFFGATYAGLVPVPLYPPNANRLESDLAHLGRVVSDCDADAIVCAPEFAALRDHAAVMAIADVPWLTLNLSTNDIWEAAVPATGDTTAFLQYTSGSTGHPKGVRLSHANVLANQRCIASAMRANSSSVFVSWLPMYHDMGLVGCIFQPLYLGVPCWLLPTHRFIQQPLRWLSAISQAQATISGAPNFAFDLCARRAAAVKSHLDLSSWQVAFNGSEPIRSESLERFYEAFRSFGLRREALFPCYGMAEASLIITGAPTGPRTLRVDPIAMAQNRIELSAEGVELVSCGPPAGDNEIRVVSEQETEVGTRQIGQIWVRGDSIAKAYWGRDSHLCELDGEDGGTGLWLKTGDAGFIDEGELFVSGRLKDLIIVRGRKYLPEDLERTVRDQLGSSTLLPSCAFALQDESIVFVQETRLKDQAGLEQLAATIRRNIFQVHGCVVSEVVLCVPKSIPKTLNGKIRRSSCRELYQNQTLEAVWVFSLARKKEELDG